MARSRHGDPEYSAEELQEIEDSWAFNLATQTQNDPVSEMRNSRDFEQFVWLHNIHSLASLLKENNQRCNFWKHFCQGIELAVQALNAPYMTMHQRLKVPR